MDTLALCSDVVIQKDTRLSETSAVDEMIASLLTGQFDDNEIVCIAGKRGKRYTFNLTGFAVLSLLKVETTLEDVVDKIDAIFTYDDKYSMRESIRSFVMELVALGLVVTNERNVEP